MPRFDLSKLTRSSASGVIDDSVLCGNALHNAFGHLVKIAGHSWKPAEAAAFAREHLQKRLRFPELHHLARR